MRLPRSNAQSYAASALDDVQTNPPLRPHSDLIDAVEFIYVIGMISAIPSSPSPRTSIRSSQASSTSSIAAMSAIEHPAAMFGRMTC